MTSPLHHTVDAIMTDRDSAYLLAPTSIVGDLKVSSLRAARSVRDEELRRISEASGYNQPVEEVLAAVCERELSLHAIGESPERDTELATLHARLTAAKIHRLFALKDLSEARAILDRYAQEERAVRLHIKREQKFREN